MREPRQRARAHQRRLHLPEEGNLRRGDRASVASAIRLDNDRKATLYAHFYLGLVYLERDMFEDAQTFFQKTLALGPNLIEAYYELGRAYWFNGAARRGAADVARRVRGEQVQSVGKAVRRGAADRGAGRGAVARSVGWRARVGASLALVAARSLALARAAQDDAPRRLDRGRFTAVLLSRRRALARSLLATRPRERHLSLASASAPARAASPSRPTRGGSASGSAPARRSGARRSPFPSRSAS